MNPHDKYSPGWTLDLSESDVLSAWRAVVMQLKAYCMPSRQASLLLNGGAGPKPPAEVEMVLHRMRARLPLLISSTREIDIFGALNAALPLMATSQGPMTSWRDFLTGYLCGLKTSPSLDIRRTRFLHEFANAITATTLHSYVARQGGTGAAPTGGSLWIDIVLEAISYGSAALAALLARRTMSVDRASALDTMPGALLGSTLWRGCPYESELIRQLCGSELHFPSCAMHWPD